MGLRIKEQFLNIINRTDFSHIVKSLKYKLFNFTLWAGRFIPAANVDVQQIHLRIPPRKASSSSFLSAFVNPKNELLKAYFISSII